MIVDVLVFVLGIQLAMMLIAALYAFLDLAYAWRRHAPLIARRIAVAAGLFGGLCWLLGAERAPFLWGAASFGVFHGLKALLTWLFVPLVYRCRRRHPPKRPHR